MFFQIKQISGTQSHSLQSLLPLGDVSKVWQVPLCIKECYCQVPTVSPRLPSFDIGVGFDL